MLDSPCSTLIEDEMRIKKITNFPNHAVDNADVVAYTSIPIYNFSKYIVRSGKLFQVQIPLYYYFSTK